MRGILSRWFAPFPRRLPLLGTFASCLCLATIQASSGEGDIRGVSAHAAGADPSGQPAVVAGRQADAVERASSRLDEERGTSGTGDQAVSRAGSAECGWPGSDWEERLPEDAGMDGDKLDEAVSYALTTTGTEQDRAGIRTDGFVIIHHGCLVAEGYARGFTRDTPHLAWSMSKSVTNALYGIAVRQGLVTMESPAAKYYPLLDGPVRGQITLEHLMFMSSGLEWSEGYEASPLKSSVIAMLYTSGRDDMAAFTASRPVEFPPGTVWEYSSGTTNLLMGILKEVLGPERYPRYPWEELFDPLGMTSAVFERDGSGTFVGSSYFYATPRDMARFGYLYLQEGVWKGRRLLPEGWVTYSTRIAPAYRTMDPALREPGMHPGGHWWLNQPDSSSGLGVPYSGVPEDAFAALGHWGQSIVVVPSLDLVIVRTGDDRDGTFELGKWLALVVAGVRQAPSP